MCGLFGVYNPMGMTISEIEHAFDLGIVSQLRGKDSAGVACVTEKSNKKLSFNVFKTVGTSTHLLTEKLKEVFLTNRPLILSGHTRLATCGLVNERNAHPIQTGRVIGCHNGVISKLEPFNDKDENADTDSRTLFKLIAEHGIKHALTEAKDGAYALVYIDQAARTINFIRNMRRPLCYMWSSDKRTMYWASETSFLEMLRIREGRNLFTEPKWFDIDVLRTTEIGKFAWKSTELEVDDSTYTVINPDTSGGHTFKKATETLLAERLRLAAPDTSKKYTAMFCPACKKDLAFCYCQGLGDKPTSVPNTAMYPYKKDGRFKDLRWYSHWKDQIIEVENVIDVLHSGCQTCTMPMKPEDAVDWTSATSVVCHQCLKDPMIWQLISKKPSYTGKLIHKPAGWANERKH